MFARVTIFFVILIQHTNGSPLQTAQSQDVLKDFLSSRIVGGEDAPEGHAKYMIALISNSWMKSLICGGSIVSPRLVLTAAHCIEPFVHWGILSASFQGVIGSNYWNATNIVKFRHHIIHPDWDWVTIKNDIGVLITTKEMVFSDRVSPIALTFDFVGGGVESFVTGWGRIGTWDLIPYRLQLLYVTTLSPKECIEGINEATQSWGFAPPIDTELEVCTFYSRGHGMCNGDSGSALVKKNSRKQIGIVSWGFPCAQGFPDVFVRVSAYRKFLESVFMRRFD